MRSTVCLTVCLLAGLGSLTMGCAGAPPRPASLLPAPTAAEREAACQAANSFYAASTLAELRTHAQAALQQAPHAPLTHELAAALAVLEGREDDAVDALRTAMATTDNSLILHHDLALRALSSTAQEDRRLTALLATLASSHPDRGQRHVFASRLAALRLLTEADLPAAAEVLSQRGDLRSFALIAPFDNQDGKGFDAELPPEREIDLAASYPGAEGKLAGWRKDVPLDTSNHIDFASLVTPDRDVAAFALTFVRVPAPGSYRLRITTSAALSVWVDDSVVLSERAVNRHSPDQFVVNVELGVGWHKLLFKSCQLSSDWRLGAALTDASGAPVKGLEVTASPVPFERPSAPRAVFDAKAHIEEAVGSACGAVHRLALGAALARDIGLVALAKGLLDEYRAAAPSSFVARRLAAIWAAAEGDTGQAVDLLEQLLDENDGGVPELLVRRAAVLSGQDRHDAARVALRRALSLSPSYGDARATLCESLHDSGWHEDALAIATAWVEERPDDWSALWSLATSYDRLSRYSKAEEVHARLAALWPGSTRALDELVSDALSRSDYRRAIRQEEKKCALLPSSGRCLGVLASIHRRAGNAQRAVELYTRAHQLDESWPSPLDSLGAIAYEQGRTKDAIDLWQRAAALDPSDHDLADRLAQLVPNRDELLERHVPSGRELRALAERRDIPDPLPGASLYLLLDHAVEAVSADGSVRSVITLVSRALDDPGRDKLLEHKLPSYSAKVLEAYAIGPDGRRSEPSNIRGGSIRFANVKVGSTTVVQYRLNRTPSGYLARYWSENWRFQAPNVQSLLSQLVLITPTGMPLRSRGRGSFTTQERDEDGRTLRTFTQRDVPPLILEPGSPSALDIGDHLAIGNLPDWSIVGEWGLALLTDVLRATPALVRQAQELTAGLETPAQRLNALTRFVMREIRYQQDYESFLAGVRPHDAALVLQRRYGDCKDKAVLLMALAKEVGIDTRFTLVRTRSIGEIVEAVPSMQFNHAIVYVPAQPGFEVGSFVDATPSTLDLGVLSGEVQDTWALVLDLGARRSELVRIPYSPSTEQWENRSTVIVPREDGTATASVEFTVRGPSAAGLRTYLVNQATAKIVSGAILSEYFPGATLASHTVENAEDIVAPLRFIAAGEADSAVEQSGDELIVSLPSKLGLEAMMRLPERQLPLVLGPALSRYTFNDNIEIPSGYAVRSVPAELNIATAYLRAQRQCTVEGNQLRSVVTIEVLEPRVPAAQYAGLRAALDELFDSYQEDIVLARVTTPQRGSKQRRP